MIGDPSYSINLPFDQYPCSYGTTYRAVMFDSDTNQEVDLPKFLSLDGEQSDQISRQLQERRNDFAQLNFAKTIANDVGDYTIRVYCTLDSHFENETMVQFSIKIFQSQDADWVTRPVFGVDFVNQYVKVGQKMVYSPDFVIQKNGWDVQLIVDLGRSNKFTRFDKVKLQFYTIGDLVEEIDVGPHQIFFEARFNSMNGSQMVFRETFFLIVQTNKPFDDGSGEVEIPDEEEDYNYLPIDPNAREDLIPEVLDIDEPSRPEPYIARLTETGLLTIGWDRQLRLFSDFVSLPEKKVQVRDYSAFNLQEQYDRLEFDTVLENDSLAAIQIALIDALEVRIERQDPDSGLTPINFTWNIKSYSTKYIEIQLDIANTQNIAEDFGKPDVLSVNFWGTEYFKSREGREVLYGTEVSIGVLRQINPKDAKILDDGLVYIKAYVIAIVLIATAFFSLGSLLPMWMFVNSLQIIVHSTLLNTMMPGNVHYVFVQYLNLLRLNWSVLNDFLFDRYSFRMTNTDQGWFNEFLEASDYVHLFAQNMVIISFTGIIILLTWITLALIDHYGCKNNRCRDKKFFKKKHEPWANNFALRYFYEVFFEMCICVLINITILNFDDFSTSVQWLTSVLVAVGILVYIVWMLSLFCAHGPFLDDFYIKGTLCGSFWNARPINEEYDAQGKLIRKNKKNLRRKQRVQQQQLKETAEKVSLAQTKVVPINLDLLHTERIQMSDSDLHQEPQEQDPKDQQIVEEQKNEHSVELPNQRIVLEHDNAEKTMLSTQVNQRIEFSQMMPQIDELDSGCDVHSNKKVGDSPMFGTEGQNIDLSKNQKHMMVDIMNFDSIESAQNTTSPRNNHFANHLRFIEQEDSLENGAMMNRDTGAVMLSMQDSHLVSSRAVLQVPINNPDNFGEKGNTPSYRSEATKKEEVQSENEPDQQDEHQNPTQYLEEHSLGAGMMFINPSTTQNTIQLRSLQDTPVQNEYRTTHLAMNKNSNYFGNEGQTHKHPSHSTTPMAHHAMMQQSLGRSTSQANDGQTNEAAEQQKQLHKQQFMEGGEQDESIVKSQGRRHSTRTPPTKNGLSRQVSHSPKSIHLRSPLGIRPLASQKNNNSQSKNDNSLSLMNRSARRKKRESIQMDPQYRYFRSQKINDTNNNLIILDLKREHEKVIKQNAREVIAGAELIPQVQRVKTLWYGLILNHPRHVALVHPVLFTMRRVVYTLAIVFLAKYALFGVWVVLAFTMLMLIFGVMEHQWKDSLINSQNITNEIITYMVCIFLLLFNNFVSTEMRHTLGYILIGLISIFLVYNGVIMLRKVTKLIQLLIKRWVLHHRYICLVKQVKKAQRKTQADLDVLSKPILENPFDSESDSGANGSRKLEKHMIHAVNLTRVESGGFQARIVEDEVAMARLREAMQEDDSQVIRDKYGAWELKRLKKASTQLVDESAHEEIGTDRQLLSMGQDTYRDYYRKSQEKSNHVELKQRNSLLIYPEAYNSGSSQNILLAPIRGSGLSSSFEMSGDQDYGTGSRRNECGLFQADSLTSQEIEENKMLHELVDKTKMSQKMSNMQSQILINSSKLSSPLDCIQEVNISSSKLELQEDEPLRIIAETPLKMTELSYSQMPQTTTKARNERHIIAGDRLTDGASAVQQSAPTLVEKKTSQFEEQEEDDEDSSQVRIKIDMTTPRIEIAKVQDFSDQLLSEYIISGIRSRERDRSNGRSGEQVPSNPDRSQVIPSKDYTITAKSVIRQRGNEDQKHNNLSEQSLTNMLPETPAEDSDLSRETNSRKLKSKLPSAELSELLQVNEAKSTNKTPMPSSEVGLPHQIHQKMHDILSNGSLKSQPKLQDMWRSSEMYQTKHALTSKAGIQVKNLQSPEQNFEIGRHKPLQSQENSASQSRENEKSSKSQRSKSRKKVKVSILLEGSVNPGWSSERSKEGTIPRLREFPAAENHMLSIQEETSHEKNQTGSKISRFEQSDTEEAAEKVGPLVQSHGRIPNHGAYRNISQSHEQLSPASYIHLKALNSVPNQAFSGANLELPESLQRQVTQRDTTMKNKDTFMSQLQMQNPLTTQRSQIFKRENASSTIPEETSEGNVHLMTLGVRHQSKRFENQSICTDNTGMAVAGFPGEFPIGNVTATDYHKTGSSPHSHRRSEMGQEREHDQQSSAWRGADHMGGAVSAIEVHQISEVDRFNSAPGIPERKRQVGNHLTTSLTRQKGYSKLSPFTKQFRGSQNQESSPDERGQQSVGGSRRSMMHSYSRLEQDSIGKLAGQLIIGNSSTKKKRLDTQPQPDYYEETSRGGGMDGPHF